MPRKNREAPGCYVPSGGLSHCEIVPISDTHCCPKSCRLGAGRIRFAENGGTRAIALSIHVEHMSVAGSSTRTIGGVSTRLQLHVLRAYRSPGQYGRG
jgi:hypothetical protein